MIFQNTTFVVGGVIATFEGLFSLSSRSRIALSLGEVITHTYTFKSGEARR